MGVTHEASSKKLNESVVNPLKTQVENEKRSLEKQRSHWSKLNATIEQSRKQLELSWQKYVTNFKERQKAYEVSEKAQNDIQLARVDQQKVGLLFIVTSVVNLTHTLEFCFCQYGVIFHFFL